MKYLIISIDDEQLADWNVIMDITSRSKNIINCGRENKVLNSIESVWKFIEGIVSGYPEKIEYDDVSFKEKVSLEEIDNTGPLIVVDIMCFNITYID
jgi:hypothetical protein